MTPSTTSLFTPIKLGDYQLSNRIFMAPLTRARAEEDGTPSPMMAEYYGQRASAGLIVAEATAISRQGRGWMNSPGIYTERQKKGWQQIADSVHQKEGRIFVQLWHMGATVHPDFVDGEQPVSSSDVTLTGALTTPKGRDREFAQPRPLSKLEIKSVIQDFVTAARNAIDAGLDGVELHGANGFLIDQFTRDSSNTRTDEYGGSIDNRLRFMLEVVEAVTAEIGAGKVGIRLSPTNSVWGISDSEYQKTFVRAAERLDQYSLAYLHLLEPKPELFPLAEKNEDEPDVAGPAVRTMGYLTPEIRRVYQGTLISNGGYNQQTGHTALQGQQADAIVYGVPFIANPDLVARYANDLPLANPDTETFYGGGAEGYSDYPTYQAEEALV